MEETGVVVFLTQRSEFFNVDQGWTDGKKLTEKISLCGDTIGHRPLRTLKNFDLWVGNTTTPVSSIVLVSHVIYNTTGQ